MTRLNRSIIAALNLTYRLSLQLGWGWTREEEIDGLLPMDTNSSNDSPYSIDVNIWGRNY